jgi:hypothetical protein
VLVYPKDPQHDFAGKRLQADFAACSDRQIKVPFCGRGRRAPDHQPHADGTGLAA